MGDEQTSDEALMVAVAAGEVAALGQLVRRHQDRALRLARGVTGSEDVAEDIVQDAFLRVFKAAKRYRPTAKFTTWLHRIIVNLCLDRQKKWSLPTLGDGSFEAPDRSAVASPDSAATDETRRTVRRAVAGLPARQRLAVVLQRFEGYRLKEICEVTGWSQSAVESCLVRAYRQLREELAPLAPQKPEKAPQENGG